MRSSLFNSKFQKRAVSAIILGPAALFIIAWGGWPFVVFVALCTSLGLYEWISVALKTDRRAAFILLGLVYVPLAFLCCYWLRDVYGARIALLFIVMVWASDIGAYFTGKIIGGPKMAADISPNKTWAGLAGAAFFPALCGTLYLSALDYITGDLPGLKDVGLYLAALAITGLVLGFVGQAGDLLISWLKRCAGVKDTGTLIPGHGGLLDRVDAMLLSAPVFLVIVVKFGHVFTG